MRKNTQWLLVITGCITFMLACFCADQQVEMEDYEYEVRSQDGGNTDKGYYVITPKPMLPLVLGSQDSYRIRDWEDDGTKPVQEIEIYPDEEIGPRPYYLPKKEGVYTIRINGKPFTKNADYSTVSDGIDVRVVRAKKVVIDGFCASKVLATNTSQFVSVRFAYDDQEGALAYGTGYYPLGFDVSQIKIPPHQQEPDKAKSSAHTMRTMNVVVSKDVPEQITLFDKLDNDRPIVFTTTTSKKIDSGKFISMPEYQTKTNNPDQQRLLLMATLDDGSKICPEEYEVTSLTPEICRVRSDFKTFIDFNLPAGDPNRRYDDYFHWYIKAVQEGVCKIQATVKGFDGLITQEIAINAQPIRTIEIRQREKERQSRGSGGGSGGFDYD